MPFFTNFYLNSFFVGFVGAMILATLMIFFRLIFKSTLQLSESFGRLILGKKATRKQCANLGTSMHLLVHTLFGAAYGIILPYIGLQFKLVYGLIYGLSLWILLNLISLPSMNLGFFGSKLNKKILTTTLVYYIIFGLSLSWLFSL